MTSRSPVSSRTAAIVGALERVAFVDCSPHSRAMSVTFPRRRVALLIAGLLALLALALPVVGAGPLGKTPPGQAKERPDKGPEVEATIVGVVEESTDDKGRPTFTITTDGVTWELSAGPKWFHGENSPLAAFVGRSVEIAGTYRDGAPERELDVHTVDGQPLREEGKPPWAGGPHVVGESHPGWKEWMADGERGKDHGRKHAPGQTKDKSTEPDD